MQLKSCKLLVILCLYIAVNGYSQTLNPLPPALKALHPVNIFPQNLEKGYEHKDKNKDIKASVFELKSGVSPLFVTEVFSATKSHYDVQANWKSSAPIKKGDILLARFSIRSIYAKQESGEAVVYFFVQQGAPSFEKSVIVDISAGPEWKPIEIPFKALHSMNIGECTMAFTFGALPQKVEIANVQVLNFEQKITLENLPVTRFTYQGREENAAWRKVALQRIEEIRTAPLSIKVIDSDGKPVVGAVVSARLKQSQFIWGTAVNEALLANKLPDSNNYMRILKELFNTAVIENGFKAASWQGKPDRKPITMHAFEWLQQEGFRQRGHNLVWPGWKFNSALTKTLAQKDTVAFRQFIEEDIKSKMTATKGKVIAWDVINEYLHERDFFPFLAQDAAVRWFQMAKSLDSSAQLFINDYSMLNSIVSPRNIKEYIDTINSLRQRGAPIEAIGIQGHVGRQPRNPAQIISDLDLFTPVGLPVQITEFDINMTDDTLQADYTKDFLIACYSHPIVTGFTIWGFWQGAHWKPDAAMFRKDWTAKPNAAVWREWVTGKWQTSIKEKSDAKGLITSRGHLGEYEILVTYKDKSIKVNYQLTKNEKLLEIKL